MDDLISRQAAIDALMNNEPSAWYNDDYERGEIARFHEDVTTIKNVPSVRRKRKPSAQPEPRWTPVEECLPDLGIVVWVTLVICGRNIVTKGQWDGVKWIYPKSCAKITMKVTAWMPIQIPKPYERSEE